MSVRTEHSRKWKQRLSKGSKMADDTNPVVTGGSSDSDAPYSNELRELGTIDPGEPASRNNRWGEDMFKTPFSWPGIPGL